MRHDVAIHSPFAAGLYERRGIAETATVRNGHQVAA